MIKIEERAWTNEDVNYLQENWGEKSITTISKNLNRNISAVMNKKSRLRLGAFLESGEYLTVNQLFKAIGRVGGTSYTLERWISKGLPVRFKKVMSNTFKVIYLKDFWKWAERYRMHIDFYKFKENALGKEPAWAKEQRKADIEFAKYKVGPWTKEEDANLKGLLKLYRYTYRELSIRTHRTEGAIKHRINDLGIKEWPLRQPSHSKWSEAEINTVIKMYKQGYRSAVIKEYINKSEQAINGKIERFIKEGIIEKWL